MTAAEPRQFDLASQITAYTRSPKLALIKNSIRVQASRLDARRVNPTDVFRHYIAMGRGREHLICTPGVAPCEDLSCGVCMPRRPFGLLESGPTRAPLSPDLSSRQPSGPELSGGSSAPETARASTPMQPSKPKASSRPRRAFEEVMLKIQARIARALKEESNPSSMPRRKELLHKALEYVYALKHRLRGLSGPAPRAEMWRPLQVETGLQEIIPERFLKEGVALAGDKTRKKRQISLIFAVHSYLDELELDVTGFGEDAVQSPELDEEEWNGFSDTDVAQDQQQQANAGQGAAHLERVMKEQVSSLDAFEEVLDVYRNTTEDCRLRIRNLALATTEAELEAFFSSYGVKTVSILPSKRKNGVACALISLWDAAEAQKATSELSGKELLGCRVSVSFNSGKKMPTVKVARKRRKLLIKSREERALEDKTGLISADAEARRISGARVENAVVKMEQWCDLWIGGKIHKDQWHTFSDCLDRE